MSESNNTRDDVMTKRNDETSIRNDETLVCPVCGKTYPASKRNAYNAHVYRHKRNASNASANAKFRDNRKAVASTGDSAASVTDGGSTTPVVESGKMGTSETAPAELAEIPPVMAEGTVETPAGEGEERGRVGLDAGSGLIIGALDLLFRGKGAPALTEDEKRRIERAAADPHLAVETDARTAGFVNFLTAAVSPVVLRIKYFLRGRSAPSSRHLNPSGADAHGPSEPNPAANTPSEETPGPAAVEPQGNDEDARIMRMTPEEIAALPYEKQLEIARRKFEIASRR